MFGFDLLFTIIVVGVLYGLVALAVVSYAAHRKNSEVLSPVPSRYDRARYELAYTPEQEARRDFWECVQVFSCLWPAEAVIGCGYGIYRAFANGIRYLIRQTTKRTDQATERKIVLKIEEERARLLAAPDTRTKQESLASLEHLLTTRLSPTMKELTR